MEGRTGASAYPPRVVHAAHGPTGPMPWRRCSLPPRTSPKESEARARKAAAALLFVPLVCLYPCSSVLLSGPGAEPSCACFQHPPWAENYSSPKSLGSIASHCFLFFNHMSAAMASLTFKMSSSHFPRISSTVFAMFLQQNKVMYTHLSVSLSSFVSLPAPVCCVSSI